MYCNSRSDERSKLGYTRSTVHEEEMSESLQTHDMNEFLALAEHYRALLQETGRSAALLRRVERGRGGVAQDDDEALRAAYNREHSETIAVAGHVRRGLAGTGHSAENP